MYSETSGILWMNESVLYESKLYTMNIYMVFILRCLFMCWSHCWIQKRFTSAICLQMPWNCCGLTEWKWIDTNPDIVAVQSAFMGNLSSNLKLNPNYSVFCFTNYIFVATYWIKKIQVHTYTPFCIKFLWQK